MRKKQTLLNSFAMHRVGWFIFLLAALFYIYEYVLRVLPGFMTAELMSAHHISASTLGNLVAFYYYIYAPMQIPVGILMDRYGPRRLLTLATLSCSLGSFLFVYSNSILIAEIGRFLTGFGSAFAFVGALKVAVIWVPKEKFGFVSGLATTLGTVAAVFSDWVLPHLLHSLGWKEVSYWLTFIGVLLAIILFLWVKDGVSEKKTIVKHKKSLKKDSLHFRALFKQLLAISKNPQIWLNGLIACFLYIPTSAFAELWGIPYLETVKHLSSAQASKVISMIFVGWAIGGPMIGAISDKFRSRRRPICIGMLCAAIILSGTLFYLPSLSPKTISFCFFAFGLFSSCQVLTFAISRELSPVTASGTAVALNNMCVMLGGAALQPLIGLLLDRNWTGHLVNGLHIYSVHNYQQSLSILPICLFLGVLCTLFLKETFKRES